MIPPEISLETKTLAVEAPDGYGDKDGAKEHRRDQRQPGEHRGAGHKRNRLGVHYGLPNHLNSYCFLLSFKYDH
jgi:hypothetical protein